MSGRFLTLDASDPQQVGGYVLHARLGTGGMANVYLSYRHSGNPVAIKVLKPEFADDPEFRRRFRQEVSAARRVQGRYTAAVVDADTEGRLPWLAAEYVAGPSLQRAVAEHGPLPLRSALELVAGVGEGLASIHAVGLVHRDLKPSNVLLAADRPRIIDFGIARATEFTDVTSTGKVVGTPAYMAPEQVRGDPVTPASDIFALGQVAVFAVTGHTAFGEGNGHAIGYRIVHGQPDLAACPPELLAVIEHCLAKDPADRPSAAEVTASARRALGPQPDSAGSWLPRTLTMTLAAYQSDAAPRSCVPLSELPTMTAAGRTQARPAPGTASRPQSPQTRIPRRRQRGRMVIVGIAGIVAVAVVILARAILGQIGHSPPAAAQTTGTASATNSAAVTVKTYVLEYSGKSFKLPGSGCNNGTTVPSSVNFPATGPQVSTEVIFTGDLYLDCSLFQVGLSSPSFDAYGLGAQAAIVSNNSGAAACDSAVTRDPIGEFEFSQLQPGTQVCLLIGYSTNPGQVVRIRLVAENQKTFDTSWVATAWTIRYPST